MRGAVMCFFLSNKWCLRDREGKREKAITRNEIIWIHHTCGLQLEKVVYMHQYSIGQHRLAFFSCCIVDATHVSPSQLFFCLLLMTDALVMMSKSHEFQIDYANCKYSFSTHGEKRKWTEHHSVRSCRTFMLMPFFFFNSSLVQHRQGHALYVVLCYN